MLVRKSSTEIHHVKRTFSFSWFLVNSNLYKPKYKSFSKSREIIVDFFWSINWPHLTSRFVFIPFMSIFLQEDWTLYSYWSNRNGFKWSSIFHHYYWIIIHWNFSLIIFKESFSSTMPFHYYETLKELNMCYSFITSGISIVGEVLKSQ